MNIAFLAFLSTVLLFNTSLIKAETVDEKLGAYSLIVEALPKLESQLDLINESIDLAEEKIKSNQTRAAQGHAGGKAVVELFREQLESLEGQKEEADSQLNKLNAILSDLKKDPEVGSVIVANEATRQLKQKLDKASARLPKGFSVKP
jgi:chromosome segregation ATPase